MFSQEDGITQTESETDDWYSGRTLAQMRRTREQLRLACKSTAKLNKSERQVIKRFKQREAERQVIKRVKDTMQRKHKRKRIKMNAKGALVALLEACRCALQRQKFGAALRPYLLPHRLPLVARSGPGHGVSRPPLQWDLCVFHKVSQGPTRSHKVAQGLTRSHQVSQGLKRSHKAPQGLTRSHKASQGLTRPHRVSRGDSQVCSFSVWPLLGTLYHTYVAKTLHTAGNSIESQHGLLVIQWSPSMACWSSQLSVHSLIVVPAQRA